MAWLDHVLLSIHLLMGVWVVSTFWLECMVFEARLEVLKMFFLGPLLPRFLSGTTLLSLLRHHSATQQMLLGVDPMRGTALGASSLDLSLTSGEWFVVFSFSKPGVWECPETGGMAGGPPPHGSREAAAMGARLPFYCFLEHAGSLPL